MLFAIALPNTRVGVNRLMHRAIKNYHVNTSNQ